MIHAPLNSFAPKTFYQKWSEAVIGATLRLVVCTIVTVVVGYGLNYSRSSIDLLKLFDHRAKILQDYRWLEANLGKLVPLEIVVRFPVAIQREVLNADGQETNWSALSFVQRLETITRNER